MTDLSKGIIEIDGFEVKPGTTLEEMKNFFGDKVRVLDLSTGPRLKLQKPYYVAPNIYAYGFNFDQNNILRSFGFVPEVPEDLRGQYIEVAKYKVEASKKWLKGMIDEAPTSEGDENICYSYKWGYVIAQLYEDRDYGLRGGEIDVEFRED